MSQAAGGAAGRVPGLILLFTRHPNASNLLMAIMLLTGFYGLGQLNRQFFPTVDVPTISVSVAWPGASAEDVEANIIKAVEAEIRGLDGAEDLRSFAFEGSGVAVLEFQPGTDMQKALSEIETAVAGLTTLPQEAERPVISRATFFETVASLSLSGPFSERALRAYAKEIRDDLLDLRIDRVQMQGVREEEIWIETGTNILRRFGLTLEEIARRVNAASEDLPSGTLRGGQERQLRALGSEIDPGELGQIEIRSLESGEKILLRDIAVVREAFKESDPTGSIEGRPAVRIDIQRSDASDILDLSEKISAYVVQARASLPPTLQIDMFNVQADLVRQRIGLLLRNGLSGLILVLITLFIFLNARVAFWVAVGIPVAVISAFLIMSQTGQSINMISLFAMLMMLGIIVDDAIVVGEHAATLRERGLAPRAAAQQGAARMLPPVMASSLTTMAAFLPILTISGTMGEILGPMALVVITVIAASLIECFLILPGHLRESLRDDGRRVSPWRARFNRGFERLREGWFARLVTRAYDRRGTTLAAALGALIVCGGLLAGGRAGFQFFPAPEGERIGVSMRFTPGTSRSRTQAALMEVQAAARRAELALGGAAGSLIQTFFSRTGALGAGGGGLLIAGGLVGDNVGELYIELISSEARAVRTYAFVAALEKEIPPFVGLEQITVIERRAGPPGQDIDIRLEDAPLDRLKAASGELRGALKGFRGVRDIEDDLPYGKQELIVSVTPRGAALGFTAQEVGRQLRNAFQGAIARRVARDDEEVVLRVRLPESESDARAFADLHLRTGGGVAVPLSEIVALKEKAGFARIARRDGVRKVSVSANVAPSQGGASPDEIIAELEESFLPGLARRHGVRYQYGGRLEEQSEAFADLRVGALVALAMIYFILAWVFGHYGRPVVVMSIIPFGLIGAILGHMVMGYPLTFLTMIALLGLSGILVNDSIVLVTQVQKHLQAGLAMREAAIQGAKDRLRAVLLTSITTIAGLTPLLFERSLQAEFLKPMAITISFGLLVGTALVLVVVPAFLGLQDDAARRLRGGRAAAAV